MEGVRLAASGEQRVGLDEESVGKEPEPCSGRLEAPRGAAVPCLGIRTRFRVRVNGGGACLGEQARQGGRGGALPDDQPSPGTTTVAYRPVPSW